MHHVLKDAIGIIGQKYFKLVLGPARYQRGQSNGLFKVILLLVILLSPCYVVPLTVTPANNAEDAAEEAEEPPAVAPASNPDDAEEVSDEDRLSWIEGMEQSPSWIHERVFAKMLGYDSSTEEGMADFKTFINRVQRGGTGRQGRDWVPTPAPCNGEKIELDRESVDNPLHLHRRRHGTQRRKDDRAPTDEPTADVVKQKEMYYTFKFDGQITLALDQQYKLIRHVTGLEMDQNDWRLHIEERRQEQWEACLTGQLPCADLY